MRFAILANPAAGRLSLQDKRVALAEAAGVLGAEVHGLDTRSRVEFQACARELAGRVDCLVVAGGDGSLSDVLNGLDTSALTLSYLPLGTGNAIGHALGLRGRFARLAERIREGRDQVCDLVEVDERRRGFLVSIGFDGEVVRARDAHPERFARGLRGYAHASLATLLNGFRPAEAEIELDGERVLVRRLFTLAVVKEPFYGYGFKVVPSARLADGRLHGRALRYGVLDLAALVVGGFTFGNPGGRRLEGRVLDVRLARPAWLQVDGNLGWRAERFTFRVLPGAWRLRY